MKVPQVNEARRQWAVSNKRINARGNAVFDLHRDGRFFTATIEIRSDAPQGIKVLLGALQPAGKERAWDAIRAYEGVGPVDRLQHHVTGAIERGEAVAIVELPVNPRSVDERTVAERKWRAPVKAPANQKPCDVGLFSDDSKQKELF